MFWFLNFVKQKKFNLNWINKLVIKNWEKWLINLFKGGGGKVLKIDVISTFKSSNKVHELNWLMNSSIRLF